MRMGAVCVKRMFSMVVVVDFLSILLKIKIIRVKCGTWRALSLNSLRQHGLVVTMINMFMVVVVMFIICPLISTESPDINFNTTYHSK